MCKVIVNRLRLNQLYVGYRVEAIKTNGKHIFFDVTNELLNPFLRFFSTEEVSKGVIIDGREVGGVFFTDNESDVHEVETLSNGRKLVEKYYRCNPEYMSEEEYYNHLMSYINDGRVDLSKVEYGSFGDVPKVYSLLEKAAKGVDCNIQLFDEDDEYRNKGLLRFNVVFVDFRDRLEFIHNIMTLLNRKVWLPEVEIWNESDGEDGFVNPRKYKIPYVQDKSEFICISLEKFGIPNKKYLTMEEVMAHGSAGFGGFLSSANIRPEEELVALDELTLEYHCFGCTVPIPSVDGPNADPSDPKYRVKWVVPVKERKSSADKMSISRCNELISSFVTRSFHGNINFAFTRMMLMGFNANELAGRFGFTKEIYRDWLESADPELIAKARESLQQGKAKISLERYKELLNEVIDFVMVGESLSNSIRELFAIGFTANELVNQFNFNKEDVDQCLAEDIQ